LYQRIRHDPVLARRIGISLGEILAERHTRISEIDVADRLPRRVSWPNSCDWIRERLPDVVEDRELLRHAEKVLQMYEGLSVEPSNCVLVHSDVGLHNVAVDDVTDAVNGIFDYDSAVWADRHHDFRYLVFDFGEDNLLEAALSVYEPIVGAGNSARRRLWRITEWA
jgi:Ser/Thr protein kinase RdoA (MazF antagonist)